MRVLVVLTPLMYREAIAHSLSQNRPHLEVRIAAPEAVEELRSFAPHLLVHTDTEASTGRPWRVFPPGWRWATPTA
jgi:hypothetical protein